MPHTDPDLFSEESAVKIIIINLAKQHSMVQSTYSEELHSQSGNPTFHGACKPKVSNLDHHVLSEKHVSQLEVSVNDYHATTLD